VFGTCSALVAASFVCSIGLQHVVQNLQPAFVGGYCSTLRDHRACVYSDWLVCVRVLILCFPVSSLTRLLFFCGHPALPAPCGGSVSGVFCRVSNMGLQHVAPSLYIHRGQTPVYGVLTQKTPCYPATPILCVERRDLLLGPVRASRPADLYALQVRTKTGRLRCACAQLRKRWHRICQNY